MREKKIIHVWTCYLFYPSFSPLPGHGWPTVLWKKSWQSLNTYCEPRAFQHFASWVNSFKPHKNACNTWKLGSLLSPCHRWGNWGCLINLRSLHRGCPFTVAAPSPLGTEPVYPGLTCWRSQLPHLVALTDAWGPWHGEIGYHLVTEPITHPTLGWQGLVCLCSIGDGWLHHPP